MKILFFGFYDRPYSRNRVLMTGRSENGCEIVECHVDPRQVGGLQKYQLLYRKARALRHEQFDFVLVGFPGHTAVLLAKILFPRTKIVFDAFLSLYDSNVFDRKVYGQHSLRGLRDWFLDWHASALADKVLLDTNQHIDYFAETFGIRRSKCVRVPISVDTEVFYPRPAERTDRRKVIHFQGMFIPLQGLSTIIDAAELAEKDPWVFKIVGSGQEFAALKKRVEEKHLSNVEFTGKVPLETVAAHTAAADVCLGIFGATAKTQRVIPNKVYEGIAMARPVISADTPAMREYFTDGENIILVTTADAQALYQALKRVLSDASFAGRLARGGRALFESLFTPRKVVCDMLKSLSYGN